MTDYVLDASVHEAVSIALAFESDLRLLTAEEPTTPSVTRLAVRVRGC
jgi:hypothetical protein